MYLWLYALLPITFHCVRRSVASRHIPQALGWAWLAGLSTIATMTAYGIAFHGILVFIIVLAHIPRSAPRAVQLWLTYSASAIAGSSYWLLAELIGFRQTFQNGTSWALFTTKDMYILSPTSALPFAIRGVYRDWTAALASQVFDNRLIAVALLAGFALPISAVLAPPALAKRAGATGAALLVVGAISLVMANGTGPPVGDAYARLASAPFVSQVAFVLFKGPYKWVPLAVFVMLFMGTAAVSALLTSTRRTARALGTTAAIGLVVWAFVLGSPLLTGDLAHYMRPVQPPDSLRPSLSEIATLTADDETKAIWLPFSTTGDPLNPPWVPSRAHLPLIDGGVPPVTSWEAPSPISSRGVSWLGPASGRTRDQLIENILLDDPEAELGSLMTALGCRLIVIRMDVSAGPALARLVAGHLDVRLAFQDRYFAVFKSIVPQQTVQSFSPAVLVAGLDSLAVGSSIAGPAPALRPYVLASDIPAGFEDLFISSASELWFGPGKGWADLALDIWRGSGRIVNAADIVSDTVPLSAWDKDSFNSNLWVPARLAGLKGSLFEPSKAPVFLVAARPAELTLPLHADDAGSEVWARIFVSPLGDTASAWASGAEKATTNTLANTTMGWQWTRLLRLPNNSQSQLHLSVTGQLSAIDQVAIVPNGAVATAVARLKQLSASADIVSGGPWQALTSPIIPADAVKNGSSITLEPRSGSLLTTPATSQRLPAAIAGYSHPSSGFWAFALRFTPQDWSSAESLSLDFSSNAPQYGSPDVTLYDAAGNSLPLRYSLPTPTDLRVFSLTANRLAPQAGGDLDFSQIARIDFSFPTYVDPKYLVRLEVRSAITQNRSDRTRVLDTAGEGRYLLAVQPTGHAIIKQVEIDGIAYPLSLVSNGWATTSPIGLPDGSATITFDSKDIVRVLLWRGGQDGGLQSRQSILLPTGSSTTPSFRPSKFQQLNYFENFDPGWVARGGTTIVHYRVNGFINGYVGEWRPEDKVVYFYSPDDWIVRGRVASAVVLTATAFAFLLFRMRTRSRSIVRQLLGKQR
jgi:hypothetical protein